MGAAGAFGREAKPGRAGGERGWETGGTVCGRRQPAGRAGEAVGPRGGLPVAPGWALGPPPKGWRGPRGGGEAGAAGPGPGPRLGREGKGRAETLP